jgi:hypothetical protein
MAHEFRLGITLLFSWVSCLGNHLCSLSTAEPQTSQQRKISSRYPRCTRLRVKYRRLKEEWPRDVLLSNSIIHVLVSSNDPHFSTLQSRLLNIWHESLDVHLGLAKSNSHLYAVLAYEPVALLESTEPTGALVIDTLPPTIVARRDFPLPTNLPPWPFEPTSRDN